MQNSIQIQIFNKVNKLFEAAETRKGKNGAQLLFLLNKKKDEREK